MFSVVFLSGFDGVEDDAVDVGRTGVVLRSLLEGSEETGGLGVEVNG